MAALYLGRVCPGCDDKLLAEVEPCLLGMVTGDAVFGPRFQARFALRMIGKPVPLDCPGGVFLFKTILEGAPDCSRTVALQSEQTLEVLHLAIQDAFEWDADHLYSFFMNNKPYDWRYTFVCPYEEDNPPCSDEAVIGELGLTKKHKLLYLFDYGDSRYFEVQVVDIKEKAEEREYPCVVDEQGRSPKQYGEC